MPFHAQMLILGAIFRCLDRILTITAGLSSKPLFVSPMDKREEANKFVDRFSGPRGSLLIFLIGGG
jgi:ATP-dependent RNA helicase DHX57